MVLGSVVAISQFAFIMGGTFVYYSWDVMEPISYIMLLSNFVVGFFFYAALKRNMELATIRELLANRFGRKLYKKRGLDIEKLEKLQKEIIELRHLMNKSNF